jgi:nicotinamidase-related amidase
LLILDMISEWQFPDADKLLPHALATASHVAALKARCRRAGVPVIYGNDNYGAWRSDLRQVVESSLAGGGAGARITTLVAPQDDDYFVLKPKHSAFFGTPLDLLLQHLSVRRLLLAGVASDQCVMATAMDARMRDYEVLVVSDCVASQTAGRNRRALEHFQVAMAIRTTRASRIRLPRPRRQSPSAQ